MTKNFKYYRESYGHVYKYDGDNLIAVKPMGKEWRDPHLPLNVVDYDWEDVTKEYQIQQEVKDLLK